MEYVLVIMSLFVSLKLLGARRHDIVSRRRIVPSVLG